MSLVNVLDNALGIARDERDQSLADFVEELRIPSVSTLQANRADCLRNAEWLVARLQKIGFQTQLVDVLEGGHPVLRADWLGRPGQPTLTIYGHYDVQPPDPLDEWDTDPFDPTVRDGKLYARGVSDNKCNHLAAVRALECWHAAGGPPVNVRLLIEGEEEIGGESLPTYLHQNAADLKTDYVLVWDGGFSQDGKPSLCVALRGMLYVQIDVQGPSTDIHSGGYGGAAPNPALALARILSGLKDADERATVPGFYDDVVTPDPAEVARWHVPDAQEDLLLAQIGTDALVGEAGFDVRQRLWARPTLEINGMHSGFIAEGVKTIIPARASAKVSMRLVANQDPAKILESLRARVAELTGPGIRSTVTDLGSSRAVAAGFDHPGARAASKAFEDTFGTPAVLTRSGGSIPVSVAFQDAIGAPLIVSGIASPNSRAHGPNENQDIEIFQGGIEMLIRLLDNLAS